MSFGENSHLSASLVIENITRTGEVSKRSIYRTCQLVLGRNEFSDIILTLTTGKTGKVTLKYPLKDCQVHCKFASAGKASIRINQPSTLLLLSNCPPDKLILFIKTISTKSECMKIQKSAICARKKLLSSETRSFQEISPLTMKELETVHNSRAKEMERSDLFTPKGKRRREDDKENKVPQLAKKTNSLLKSQKVGVRAIIPGPAPLTKEQLAVLDVVKSGTSVFFTGSAGTGKSFLMKRIIGILPPEHTFATASTGVAACHIGGTTLHAFAGIGSGKASLSQCVELASRPTIVQQWKRAKHLIIDEISMVDGQFFEKLEAVARIVRKRDESFGGIQLILSGDFLQLPPVFKHGEKRTFAFQTKAWRKSVSVQMELTVVKRQTDNNFIRILRNIRMGKCTSEMSASLMSTANHKIDQHGILATRLCTHTEDVLHINQQHLNKLKGETRDYEAVDSDKDFVKQINQLSPVEDKLVLKIGAQVMLAKNMDVSRGLVNGARGVVTRFEGGDNGLPVITFMSGQTEIIRSERFTFKITNGIYLSRKQLPLKLAWAISIHKSQGMSLDCVEMSLSRVFESGQAYVALSRARTMEGLRVLDFDPSCVRAHPDVLKFYQNMRTDN